MVWRLTRGDAHLKTFRSASERDPDDRGDDRVGTTTRQLLASRTTIAHEAIAGRKHPASPTSPLLR
ncbi:hypothetical protein ASE64_13835 [Agreia sp. Leaf210]|nr:hypothetical protein ASE64_13835 [Agreia sp. Leaf210]